MKSFFSFFDGLVCHHISASSLIALECTSVHFVLEKSFSNVSSSGHCARTDHNEKVTHLFSTTGIIESVRRTCGKEPKSRMDISSGCSATRMRQVCILIGFCLEKLAGTYLAPYFIQLSGYLLFLETITT